MISHEKKLLGYADQISRQPGEEINFKVSSSIPGEFELNIVRIRCGDDMLGGPGLKQTVVDTPINSSYRARFQKTQVGSFVKIQDSTPFNLQSFTLQAMIWPTTPSEGEQSILGCWCEFSQSGYVLMSDSEGKLAIRIGSGRGNTETLTSSIPLHARRWCLAATTFQAESGKLTMFQLPLDRYGRWGDTTSISD